MNKAAFGAWRMSTRESIAHKHYSYDFESVSSSPRQPGCSKGEAVNRVAVNIVAIVELSHAV